MKTFLCLFLSFSFLMGCATPKRVIDLGFTGDYFIMPPRGAVDLSELDRPLTVTASSKMEYPRELIGMGFVGRIGGYAILNEDGSAREIMVTHGNNQLLEKPAREYVKSWSFTPPLRDSKPVKTAFTFEFLVAEDKIFGPFLSGLKKEPNSEGRVTR